MLLVLHCVVDSVVFVRKIVEIFVLEFGMWPLPWDVEGLGWAS